MSQPIAKAENPPTYSLRTLMLVVTWLAVSCRFASEGTLIGFVGLILFSLAARRMTSDCKLRPDGFAAMTTAQILLAFFESVAVVIGALFIGIALFFTTGIAALLVGRSNASEPLGLLAIVAGFLMFMIAPAATIYYLAATWPRNTGRR